MFDIGWSELLLVAAIAIIVVGPKELPRALRSFGQWLAKVRSVAREFQSGVDEMVRESELEEIRKQARAMIELEEAESTGPRIEPPPRAGAAPRPAGEGDAEEQAVAEAEAAAPGGAMAPPHSLGPSPPEAEEPAAPTPEKRGGA